MAETDESSWVYKNRDAPVEARVKDLLSRMTLPEKIGQMTQIERSVASPQVITHSFIGSIQSGAGSWPFEDAKSSDWADMIDGFQRTALASRLGSEILITIIYNGVQTLVFRNSLKAIGLVALHVAVAHITL